MASTLDVIVPTDTYAGRDAYSVGAGAIYIFGQSEEERSHFSDQWRMAQQCSFLQIAESDKALEFTVVDSGQVVPLRSDRSLADLLRNIPEDRVVIDITGLSHHVWAPLIRSALTVVKCLEVVYVEPDHYRFSDVPREGDVFDLSERTSGISPLPGFARLSRGFDTDTLLVALLGFEGARFQYVVEQVQPGGSDVVPIVGVPGFRPEFPFYSYEGNQPALESSGAWREVRFAAANCPFELFEELRAIQSRQVDRHLAIATIGTKPHALGAVLYAIHRPDLVELVYDHPIRKPGRSEGEQRTLVYHVSAFFNGL